MTVKWNDVSTVKLRSLKKYTWKRVDFEMMRKGESAKKLTPRILIRSGTWSQFARRGRGPAFGCRACLLYRDISWYDREKRLRQAPTVVPADYIREPIHGVYSDVFVCTLRARVPELTRSRMPGVPKKTRGEEDKSGADIARRSTKKRKF